LTPLGLETIFDKGKPLSAFDETITAEPMKSSERGGTP
jgi:hypothetical protein